MKRKVLQARNAQIREFIEEEIIGEKPVEVKEVSFPEERLRTFVKILGETLPGEQYRVVMNRVFGFYKDNDPKDDKKSQWLYKLAVAKLKDDLIEVINMRRSEEAEEYIGGSSMGHRHLVNNLEQIVFRNAKLGLENIYFKEKGPFMTSPWSLRKEFNR